MTSPVCPPCQRRDHLRCASRKACRCVVCPRLDWSDPPQGGTPWVPDNETLDALRLARRSCCVFVGRPRLAHYAVGRIRGGHVPQLPAEDWRASSASLGDGTAGLWLRYVGPDPREDA